jgi:hypothetical protein
MLNFLILSDFRFRESPSFSPQSKRYSETLSKELKRRLNMYNKNAFVQKLIVRIVKKVKG